MPSESEFNEVNLTNSFLPQILRIIQILAALCHALQKARQLMPGRQLAQSRMRRAPQGQGEGAAYYVFNAATYEGFKNNETEAVLAKKPVFTCEATSNSEPGEYVITVSGAEAINYTFNYVNGVLTVKVPSGIGKISTDHPVDIYHTKGYLVRKNATTLEGLAKGVYIIRSKGKGDRKVVVNN